jgi:acetyl esterase
MKFVAVAFSFLLIPLAALAQSNYPPDMQGARVETYSSTDEVDLNVWIFEPEGHDASQPRPAVVFFFGGGFRRGSPAQFKNQSKHLASRGMIAIAADYRVLNRNKVTMDVAVQDAKTAVRWVRENASRLGVDPNRIAAAGGSAGGHLAAATAILPGYDVPNGDVDIRPTPDALVLFNPVVILAPVDGRSDIVPLGDSTEIVAEANRESLSPYHYVGPGNPPTIIFHGKADSTAPYTHVELFTKAMRAAGNQCELVGYEGAGHGFANFGRGDGSAYTDTVKRMDAFFVSLDWLPAP